MYLVSLEILVARKKLSSSLDLQYLNHLSELCLCSLEMKTKDKKVASRGIK